MKSSDRLTILENIIARVGLDGPVLQEYTKTLAAMNGVTTMNAMQASQPVIPPVTQNAPIEPTLSQSTEQIPAETRNGLNMA